MVDILFQDGVFLDDVKQVGMFFGSKGWVLLCDMDKGNEKKGKV